MSHGDESPDLESLAPVERLLERFAPVGPPGDLRRRVLAATPRVAQGRRRVRGAIYLYRLAVAAGVVAAVCLNLAARAVTVRLSEQMGGGPAVWTQQAEETAQLLDGEGWGRQYLAMALRAGPLRPARAWPETIDVMPDPTRQIGAQHERPTN